jgi:hypothetical protein
MLHKGPVTCWRSHITMAAPQPCNCSLRASTSGPCLTICAVPVAFLRLLPLRRGQVIWLPCQLAGRLQPSVALAAIMADFNHQLRLLHLRQTSTTSCTCCTKTDFNHQSHLLHLRQTSKIRCTCFTIWQLLEAAYVGQIHDISGSFTTAIIQQFFLAYTQRLLLSILSASQLQ